VEALHEGAQHREGGGRGKAVVAQRGPAGLASASRPTWRFSAELSKSHQTEAFPLESSTMEEGGACSRLASEFFYGLASQTPDLQHVIDLRYALYAFCLCVACAAACFGGCRFTQRSGAASESSAATSTSSAQVGSPPAQATLNEPHDGPTEPLEISIPTIAGTLAIKAERTGCAYEIVLGRKRVLTTNCDDTADPNDAFPIPVVLKHFDGGPSPFDQVFVVQQNTMGNACNGGPIWFLGLRRDGSHIVSQQIDFCGGADPVILAESGRIVVHIPGGPPNRGIGYVPPETWAFDGRAVRRTSSTESPWSR